MTLPSVWKQKSADSMNKATVQRKNLSEHRAAYFKFNEEVRRSQYSMQVQVNDALKKKKNTLELLIDKLNSTITAAEPVRQMLAASKIKLEKELEEKRTYLEWNMKRVELRNQRAPTEWVADEPQRQLLAQETLLRDSHAQQEKNFKEIAETCSSLEVSYKELEEDIADKKLAWELNNQAEAECQQPALKLPSINCKRMDLNAATNVRLDKDVEVHVAKAEHPTLLSPNIWHGSTMKNIDKNKRIQTRSMGLCDGCDTISRKLAEAILQAHHWVAQALEERVKEQKKMIEELQEQLRLTLEEVEEAETTVAMLKQALQDLAEPLRVSEKRLEIHSKRPQRELIEDDVNIHLKSELDELKYQEALLEQRKIKVETMLSDLIGTRDEIQDDIQLKQFCVDLDTKCLEMGSYPDKK
eukprot:CAMPEP_0196574174 /NCGR_PEP_ID=MMETSP1081-20130531/3947_1 /TAXON_ID=36882 /ORGANISM="Pyramimonas amylifera, Strain CCMP720" /LENGTH=412 /DNA_ID=CAMNT_0041892119 /DNA_START=245 /DNA_END=1483 /DNA_ORIENTATION=-